MKVIGRVYLVRHGETDENREGVIQGQKDTKLNEMGVGQARMVGERFRDVKIDWAVSSDLQRAVKTAEAILEHHGDVVLERDSALRERCMGDLEGHKVGQRVGPVTGVETGPAFKARTVRWWKERVLGHGLSKRQGLESESESEIVTMVVTTHGGFITTLIRELVGSRKASGVVTGKCYNASVTVVDILENRKGVIIAFGDVTHLAAAEQPSLESNADQQYT